MCNCSCGSEEKKNALLPQVGIITAVSYTHLTLPTT